MLKKLKVILGCLLLSACQNFDIKQPLINECRIYEDSENCICFNSKGEEYTRSCFGDLAITPYAQKTIEGFQNEVYKCLRKCTKKDCTKEAPKELCPNVFK